MILEFNIVAVRVIYVYYQKYIIQIYYIQILQVHVYKTLQNFVVYATVRFHKFRRYISARIVYSLRAASLHVCPSIHVKERLREGGRRDYLMYTSAITENSFVFEIRRSLDLEIFLRGRVEDKDRTCVDVAAWTADIPEKRVK